MYRDFTNEEKGRLLGYVKDNNDFYSSCNGDLFFELSQYDDLDINDYIDDIDRYHKKLIYVENMTAKKIKQIFEAVHEKDEDTLTNIDIINGLTEALYKYMNNLKTKIVLGKNGFGGKVTEPWALPKDEYLKNFKKEFQFANAKKCAEMYDAYRDGDIEKVEKYLEREVDDLTRDVADFGGVPGATVKKSREEIVVDLYRLINPDSAKKFDELFDSCKGTTISAFDRYNIMYLAYTAEEPYRSLFLNSLGTYKLGKYDKTVKISGFISEYNIIEFDTKYSMFGDPLGPYTTFFHECGHAIDYNAAVGSESYSGFYDMHGNYDVIYGDVHDRIQLEIADYIDNSPIFSFLGKEERDSCIKNITKCIFDYDGDESKLSTANEEMIFKAVVKKIKSDFTPKKTLDDSKPTAENYHCPSDIYGGLTDRVVEGNYHHDLYEDKDKDGIWDDGEGYWFEEKNEGTFGRSRTGNIENETWAEFYSDKMTGNEKSLKCMQEYLPNTYKRYEKMAQDMLEYCY